MDKSKLKQLTKELINILTNELKSSMMELLYHAQDYIGIAENLNLTNEQWFLDFEDSLNKLSIKDHN